MNTKLGIIGLDLGHGKTALAQMFLGSRSEPQIVEIDNKKVITTAIAVDNESGFFYLGDDAVYQDQAQEFYISFKYKPSQHQDKQKILDNFVKELYRKLVNLLQIKDHRNRNIFFVGYPSGWSDKDVEQYKKNIQSCINMMSNLLEVPIPEVQLIPESRAALIHAISTDRFTLEEIQKGILIIDIGSSTTDMTFISDKFSEDYGEIEYDLGGSLIDKEILKKCLEKQEQKTKDIIINTSSFSNLCELKCRKAKESYFSSPILQNQPDQELYGEMVRLTPEIDFMPIIKGKVIQEIIVAKLEALGNRSWKEAFNEQLNVAKKNIINGGEQFGGILLTGGGSRMNFIKEICRSVFPDLEIRIWQDTEPELCIARGLARWGNISNIKEESNKKIKLYLDDKLEDMHKESFTELSNNIAKSLEDSFIEQVLNPILRKTKYKDLELTIRDIISTLEYRNWSSDSSIKNQLIRAIQPYVKTILKNIENVIIEILKEFEMPVIDIFEINQLDTKGFQIMLNDFQIKHSVRTTSIYFIITASVLVVLDAIIGIATGGLIMGEISMAVVYIGLNKQTQLITDKDVDQIIDDFRKEGKFHQGIKRELSDKISPTLLTTLRTKIDDSISTKMEFIQMLLAAKNNSDN